MAFKKFDPIDNSRIFSIREVISASELQSSLDVRRTVKAAAEHVAERALALLKSGRATVGSMPLTFTADVHLARGWQDDVMDTGMPRADGLCWCNFNGSTHTTACLTLRRRLLEQ